MHLIHYPNAIVKDMVILIVKNSSDSGNDALAQTKTKPIKRLMKIQDPEIKEKALSTISKSLETGK
jgi:hypothetical protein